MPTFRNNGNIAINYSHNGKLYSFPPKQNYLCNFWVPYQELGLELVNADYPPVPDSIMLSGTFKFGCEIERKFTFEHCNKYRLKFSVEQGTVKFYAGSSKVGVEINGDYETVLNWERAPFVRVIGVDGINVVRIDAEVVE